MATNPHQKYELVAVTRQANQATKNIDGIKVTRIPCTKSVIGLLHCHNGAVT